MKKIIMTMALAAFAVASTLTAAQDQKPCDQAKDKAKCEAKEKGKCPLAAEKECPKTCPKGEGKKKCCPSQKEKAEKGNKS